MTFEQFKKENPIPENMTKAQMIDEIIATLQRIAALTSEETAQAAFIEGVETVAKDGGQHDT